MVRKPNKKDILDFSRDQLLSWLDGRGIESYRADQILKWIFLRQADAFDVMTDISKQIRALLKQHFRIHRLEKVNIETFSGSTIISLSSLC